MAIALFCGPSNPSAKSFQILSGQTMKLIAIFNPSQRPSVGLRKYENPINTSCVHHVFCNIAH